MIQDAGGPSKQDEDFVFRLASASADERRRMLADLILSNAATVLQLGSRNDLMTDRSFRDSGFDSLTGVELRNRLNQATGLHMPSTVVFRFSNADELAEHMAEELDSMVVPTDPPATEIAEKVTPDPVESDIAVLRQKLADGVPTQTRSAAIDQLRDLLRELGDEEEADLKAASNDELFALIDEELGT